MARASFLLLALAVVLFSTFCLGQIPQPQADALKDICLNYRPAFWAAASQVNCSEPERACAVGWPRINCASSDIVQLCATISLHPLPYFARMDPCISKVFKDL